MKILMNIACIAMLILCVNCSSSKLANNGTTETDPKLYTSDFIAVTVPTIYTKGIMYLDPNDDKLKPKKIQDIPLDSSFLNSLTDITSSVTIYESDTEGSLTLLGNNATLKKSHYIIIYNFSQSQTVKKKVPNINDSIKESIGVAVRMIAQVKVKKKGINISDIFKLGVSASQEKIEGILAVRAIGISSQKVNQAIPTPSDLSPASIATALQSVATIKSHIYDKETKIVPYLIGVGIPAEATKEALQKAFNFLSI